ncbi:MAG TPA: ATP-binding protein, partial [Anaeromyxobacteraceae bacterium]|nr:ATP-binding protein [Anaeromyxobacteraceae bacterium]
MSEAARPGPPRPPRRVAPQDAIPWRHRLSTQLLGITLLLMLGVAVLFTVVEHGMREILLSQATAGADLFGETIRSATARAMLDDHRAAAYETITTIGRQPGVDRVRMINKEGRVTFSTNPAEIGRHVERSDDTCTACHEGRAPLSRQSLEGRSRILEDAGHRALGLVTPIYNEDRCAASACHRHTRAEQVLGLIDVTLSLQAADGRLATFRRESVAFLVVALVLVGGVMLVFAQRRVVRPVAALVEGTRRVARDELDVEIPVMTVGELGQLATSFNEMTAALRRVEGVLTQLNQDLERKVDERTADLTRAQAVLVQAEKLSSLGQLSASIAHEINNPLAGILTFSKLLAREAETAVPDEARRASMVRNLGLVQRETERCRAIVRNLLDFARERPLQLRDVELDKVVQESLQLIGHQLQLQGHQVVTRLAPVPPVHADFGELRQAFVNLAMNAMEAMGQGGTLTVTLRPAEEGRVVEVSIADTGPGIPAELRTKIFDPFFTTKEKGTGLGLSVVYGIVQRHGGIIALESTPGV